MQIGWRRPNRQRKCLRQALPRRRPVVEALEPRLVLAGFQPTPIEQLFLEDLNDARANPAAYGQSIGLDLSGVAPSQPLAFNPLLIEAARLHSQDMNDNGYFAHVSPIDGSTPTSRQQQTGFVGDHVAESIEAGGTGDPAQALASLIIDAGTPDLGHRTHLLNIDPNVQLQDQIGIGAVVGGSGPYRNYYTIDSAVTGDLRPFITGVVFHDDNGNGKYDIGEGYANVAITVQGAGATVTFDTGGYGIQVSPGTYTVTASGGGLAAPITRMVTVGSSSARVNFIGPAEGAWSTVAAMPTARIDAAAATGTDGRIYVIGGFDNNGQPLQTLEAYDPTAMAWSPLANMPTARGGLAAARGSDGRLYAIGGRDANGNALTTVEAYDPTSNTWTTVASLPAARKYLAATMGRGGQVYVLGGEDVTGSPSSSVYEYFPTTNNWITLSVNLATPRQGLAAATGSDGRIYAIGGADVNNVAYTTVEVYDPSMNRWGPAADLPEARKFAGAATGADGRIYVVGGSDIGYVAPAIVYTPSTGTWSTMADLSVPRTALAVTAGADGQIYALGGSAASGAVAATEALTVPTQFQFAAAAYPVNEGTANVTLTVIRTGSSAGAASVHWSTNTAGTATPNVDYDPASGTLNFADGQVSQTFTITLHDDGGIGEGNETVNLLLDSPTGGVPLAPSPGTVLILMENDPPPPPPILGGPGPGPGAGPGPVVVFATVTDITSQVKVTPVTGRFQRRQHRYEQTVTLTNVSGQDLTGPISLVLDRLPLHVHLVNRQGITQKHAPRKSPYLGVSLGGDSMLEVGETVAVVLDFSQVRSRPKYVPRVLAGPGTR
jgi:N-acetylneuraminic acid mutarotase